MTQAQQQSFGALAHVIDEHRDAIVDRWLSRLQEYVGGRDMPQSELCDAIPDYLHRIAQLLRSGGSPGAEGGAIWGAVAREHAVTRVRQEFDVSAVLREFMLLRLVLVELAREHGFTNEALFEALTQAIEAAMERTVANYVEARDAEARRREAQHVAFVTHELRNPLNTARLAVEQLRELVSATEQGRPTLERLARSHDTLEELIDSVLAVERGQAGELAPEPREARLGEIVEEALLGAHARAAAEHVQLDVHCDPLLWLRVDPKLTTSAIQNLVDNAIKYGGAHGPVEVWTESSPESVSVHVRDRCGGLSLEELRTIFVPFRRGRHRRESGTGLGLSITKQAVEAQGGSVHAESIEGGCHFWIELPRANGARERPATRLHS